MKIHLFKRTILIASLFGFLMAGCSQNPQLTNQTFVMELGTDVYANPALYLDNAQNVDLKNLSIQPVSPGITITDNRFVTVGLDYLTVGEYSFNLKNGSQLTPFVIKIKDTQPPTLKKSPNSIQLTYGQEVNWDEIFGASDLSGVYYDAPVDIAWNGQERDVEIKIRDRFGNSMSKTVHVVVK